MGDESWYSDKGSPANLVARRGKAVVQVTFQPPSKLSGSSVQFASIRRKNLLQIEAMARETLAKSVKFAD